MKKIEKTLIIPDMHCPYEDYRALEAVYQYAKDNKPDNIVLLGDVVDFYALSKFDKRPDRITGLQHEIDVAQYHLKRLNDVYKGKIVMLEGNHEFRLMRYLNAHPEVSSLKKINNVENLLDLKDYNIDYRKHYFNHGVLFKHGHVVRKHGAYSARGEFESEGTSGVSGHTHRMGSHYKTDRSGNHAWFEMGHICDENQAEYMEGKVPDWQKGFGIMYYNPSKKTWKIEQIPIVNNSFYVDGKVYSWNKNMSVPGRDELNG